MLSCIWVSSIDKKASFVKPPLNPPPPPPSQYKTKHWKQLCIFFHFKSLETYYNYINVNPNKSGMPPATKGALLELNWFHKIFNFAKILDCKCLNSRIWCQLSCWLRGHDAHAVVDYCTSNMRMYCTVLYSSPLQTSRKQNVPRTVLACS